jgi:beta-1,4-mannosyl-glycoprotein beta-1,4-N-acetylglucosaminyltransferase
MISDLDEIPNPAHLERAREAFTADVYAFCQKWYMYYLNVYCDREWFGTRACKFRYLRGKSIDLLRFHLESRKEQVGVILENGGWHFSFLGGAERIREKLDAYSYQGRRSRLFLKLADMLFPDRIDRKINSNADIFYSGRRFTTVELDDSFPKYLLDNLPKYSGHIKSA